MRGIHARATCVGVALAVLICTLDYGALPARASPLDLSAHSPDLSATPLTAQYNATTGMFTVTGFPMAFDVSGGSTPDYPSVTSGSYHIDASILPNGQAQSGTLAVGGKIAGLANSGTLLTGNLSQFGYVNSGDDMFDFVFDVTGGDLAPFYTGHKVGVILDAVNSGFNGSFTSNFASNSGLAMSDNFSFNPSPAPEPSTGALLMVAVAVGVPGMAYRRYQRKSRPG